MTLRYTWSSAARFDDSASELGRRRGRAFGVLALSAAAGVLGCNTERREGAPAPEMNVATRPLQRQPAAGGSSAAPSAAGAAAVPPSIADRPSIDENMGRGFQGTLVVRLTVPGKSYGIRYASRGNTARLQVDPLKTNEEATSRHLDVLIWGKNISLLNHQDRTVQTSGLDDVSPRSDDGDGVKIDKTGERTTLLGVGCERYEMSDGPQRASACVAALPGTFDVDKFETVANIDVPAWLEALVKDELLPLRGSVQQTERELYSFELLEYSPGPVDESQLALPANYKVITQRGTSPH